MSLTTMRGLLYPVLVPLLLISGWAAHAADTQVYGIDPENSEVYWLVSRAGALARFGHNHVVSVGEVRGAISLDPEDLANSRVELEIPVAGLIVDDPQLRKGLGNDFASVPSADDVAGTRRNMLGERVLNAKQFPILRVTGSGLVGNGEHQTLAITVAVLGRSIELTVPTQVTVHGAVIDASGEFELDHADLGMRPFSVMMGALRVGERLKFSYRMRARRIPAPAQ